MMYIQETRFTFTEKGEEKEAKELSPVKAVADSIAEELLMASNDELERVKDLAKSRKSVMSTTVWVEKEQKDKEKQDVASGKVKTAEKKTAPKKEKATPKIEE